MRFLVSSLYWSLEPECEILMFLFYYIVLYYIILYYTLLYSVLFYSTTLYPMIL